MKKAIGIAVLLCAALGGCGSDVKETEGQGGQGGGDGQGGSVGQGGKGGGGGQGGDDGSCTAEKGCPNNGVCIFPEGSCAAGSKGVCQPGFTCDGPPSGPACGCDGVVAEGEYGECTFWGKSQPYSGPELCAVGTFGCGGLACKRHVEVCVVTLPGLPGSDPTYECKAVADNPGWCGHGIGDCSCLDGMALGCPDPGSCCSADADHQETITIALP